MQVWNYNADGVIVAGNVEVRDMTHARRLAKEWNHRQRLEKQKVAIISQTSSPTGGERVSLQSGELFGSAE